MYQIKHRKKQTAIFLALLSFISLPGIGQIFSGRLGRSFLLLGILLAVALCYAAGAMNYIYSAVPIYLAFPLIWIYIAYDAYRLNADKNGVKLYWYNKWYFYILFAVIYYFIISLATSLLANYQHPRITNEKFSPTLQAGDIVMTKMNYGHSAGFNITKTNSNPFINPPTPVIIHSSPKYTVGSFILFKESNAEENKTYFGKIIAVSEDTFTSKTTDIKVPQGMVLVSVNRDEYKLISRTDIKGKLLYILWSKNISRIGTRVDR